VEDQSCTVVVEAAGMSVGLHLPPLITAPVPDGDAGADAAGDAGIADAAASDAAGPTITPAPVSTVAPVARAASSVTTAASGAGAKDSRPSSLVPIGVRVDAGALLSFETAPQVAGGFWLHGGLRWPFFTFSLGLRYEFPRTDGAGGVYASTSRFLIEAVPCLYWRHLYACGLAQAGELKVTWQSPGQIDHTKFPSIAAGGRLVLELPVTKNFSAYISGDATGSMWWTVLYFGYHLHWGTSPLNGTGATGIAAWF
jgi:hypothetical protein